MENKLGIFVNFWENTWQVDLKKYIEKAARIGYDVLEFQAQALLDMSDRELSEVKHVAESVGIELTYSLGLDPAFDISSPDNAVRNGGIEYLTNIMKQIKKMEGRLLSGVSYAGWGVPSDKDKRVRLSHSVNSMKSLARIASELGITYGIEAVNRFEGILINTAAEAREYVEMVGNPNVGILLDTYHMNIEEANIGDAIRTAGDKLVGFHVGENNRTCPGRGHLNWEKIVQALRDVNYKGRIVAEPFLMKGGEVGDAIYVWRDLTDARSETALDAEAARMLSVMRSW